MQEVDIQRCFLLKLYDDTGKEKQVIIYQTSTTIVVIMRTKNEPHIVAKSDSSTEIGKLNMIHGDD